MKTLLFKTFFLVFLIVVFQGCNEPLIEEQSTGELELKSASSAKQSYIVVLNDAELNAELDKLKGYEKKQNAVKAKSAKILKRAGISDEEIGHVYGTALKGFSVKVPPGQLKKLETDPSVKYVEEDRIFTLAPPLNINAISATSTQTIPWGIPRVNGGGENITSSSPKAWIVDSGIDLDHPDLNVNTALSKSFVAGDTSPQDAHGHGTHVAGTVAAINNDFGVIGVAPNAEVISCRVLGSDGTGYFSWTVAALDYIAEMASTGMAPAGDVVNMSLGPNSRYTSPTTDSAVIFVANEGIKIAIAAGNSSDDASYYSPARVTHDNVYTIAAMAEGDVWASYSNYGSPVDYIEPGSYITSTYIDDPSDDSDGYAIMSGTSMASPHMAGILLLGGNIVTDGTVSMKKRQYSYTYPIAIVSDGGTTPENKTPTANFNYDANFLKVDFADKSTDSDGTVDEWDWDFGGGTSTLQNPTYTFGAAGTYNVTLTVTDDDGATDSYTTSVTVSDQEPPVGGDIKITATGSKDRGTRYIDVTWSGAAGSNVDIKLNGITEITTINDDSETLNLGRLSGTFTVTVCETDGSACSNEVTVTI